MATKKEKPLTVLHLIHNLKREGAQVVLKNIVLTPSINNTRHIVCAWKHGGPLQHDIEKGGVQVIIASQQTSTNKLTEVLTFLCDFVQQNKVDVVHAHMSDSLLIASLMRMTWLRKLLKIRADVYAAPVIATHHSNKLTPSTGIESLFWFVLLFWSARKISKNIAISDSVRNNLATKLHLPEANISVVNNGVPIPVDNDTNRANDIASTVPTLMEKHYTSVLLVGRLVRLKGIEQLISAAKIVNNINPKMRFFIVGDGPLKVELQTLIDTSQLQAVVFLVGSTDDVPVWLSQAKLFVSTSHYEGIPMGILEAMAWRIPVVASNVEGTRDIVIEGQTGYLYPLNDVQALANKIETAALKQSTILVENAFKLVSQRFSTTNMTAQYERIYQDIIIHE